VPALAFGDGFARGRPWLQRAVDQHSLALVSLRAGRPQEARDLLSAMFGYAASSGNTALLENALELSAAITADLGHPLQAARLAGAAEALRQ
jgi:hypothetical protein